MKKWSAFGLTILFVTQILLIRWIRAHPEYAERHHEYFYVPVSGFLRKIFGSVPFSVGDLFYLFLTLGVIFFLIRSLGTPQRKTKPRGWHILHRCLIFLNVLYLSFQLLWGINYYRTPFTRLSTFGRAKFSEKSLKAAADLLLEKCAGLRAGLPENREKSFHFNQSREKISQTARKGFAALGQETLRADPHKVSIKASLFSRLIAYLGISGYYNPFSGEAQMNFEAPDISLPFTAMHEMSHQLGFASENEANFFGFLSAVSTKDPAFQYSAYFIALNYILQQLYANDRKSFKAYLKKFTPAMQRDFEAHRKYLKKHLGPLRNLGRTANDLFLKSNGQKEGVRSYGRFTELLMSQYEMEKRGETSIKVFFNDSKTISE